MSIRKHLVVISFYALITFCTLHNPIAHMTTHLAGTSPVDYYHFHWNYWWIRHALTTPDLNVYITNYNMAPFNSNLGYHTLAAFWFPLWALLEPVIGTLPAMMSVMVVAFTAAGYSFFLLLRREGAALGLALIGGVMLQLIPTFFIATAYNDINLLGWFWLPTLILLWGKIAMPGGRVQHVAPLQGNGDSLFNLRSVGWALVLAFVLWGMVMTDLQYPIFAAFLIVPYGLWTLWHSGGRRVHVGLIGIGGVVGALLLLWFVGPLPYMLAFSNEGLSFTPADQAIGLPFPSGYFYQIVEGAPIGYLVIPLLLFALAVMVINKRQRVGAQRAAPLQVAVLKSLSSATHAHKQSSLRSGEGFRVRSTRTVGTVPRWLWLILIPLPLILAAGQATPLYVAFHQLLGGMFRYPERFQAVFLIPSVLFAMLTLTPLVKRAQLPVTVVLLLVVLGTANIYRPMPLQTPPPTYAFYEEMGREPYDYVIVDIPTAGGSGQGIIGEAQFITTLYYALTHEKRVTNGFISRVNTWQYMYMRDSDPLMSWLGQRRLLEPEAVEAELRDHIFNYPIGYFVIHTRFIDPSRFPTVIDEITSYFNSLPDLLCPYVVENDAIVYRTAWHPDGCPSRIPLAVDGVYLLDIGAPNDVFNIGVGWHWRESVAGLTVRWMGAASQTPLYVDLPPATYEMSFTAQSYLEPRTVQIVVNGVPVDEPLTITPDTLQEYRVTIPSEAIGQGNYITVSFAYDTALVPAQIGQGGDTRALALMVDTVTFTPVED